MQTINFRKANSPYFCRFNMTGEDVLENVAVARSYNSEHMYQLAMTAGAMMSESRYALVIVDCATAQFRYIIAVQIIQSSAIAKYWEIAIEE